MPELAGSTEHEYMRVVQIPHPMRVCYLVSNFFTYRKKARLNINQRFAKLKEMRAALTNLGQLLSEEMFQAIVIDSLPQEYRDVMKPWETIHPDMKTTEFLINFLQNRESE